MGPRTARPPRLRKATPSGSDAIDIRVVDSFDEPAFTRRRKEVFATLEVESAALAGVLRQEQDRVFDQAAIEAIKVAEPALRIAAFAERELVGWTFGWFERGRSFYMASSGVIESHRRRGIYTRLVGVAIDAAQAGGAVTVRSQHSVLNNAVIIAKLRLGFHVTGLSTNARMGALLELTQHLTPARAMLFRERMAPLRAPG